MPIPASARNSRKPARPRRGTAPHRSSPSSPAGLAFIISVDLEGYSSRERILGRTLPGRSTAGVTALRDWLDQAVRVACKKARHELVWFQDQGDAWFFPVPKAVTAHRVAVALHAAAAEESVASDLNPPLRFRIGIAASQVSYPRQPPGGFDAASGSTAARLREKSAPGGTVICPQTWAALPAKARRWYAANQETFTDKHGDTFAGHRWRGARAAGESPPASPPDPTQRKRAPRVPPSPRSTVIHARSVKYIESVKAGIVNL